MAFGEGMVVVLDGVMERVSCHFSLEHERMRERIKEDRVCVCVCCDFGFFFVFFFIWWFQLSKVLLGRRG